MTKFNRLLALLAALALCFALCACGAAEDPADSNAPTQSDSVGTEGDTAGDTDTEADIEVDLTQAMFEFSSGLDNEGTALTVNGVSVPNELYLYWLSYDCYYLDYYYYQMGSAVDFTAAEVQEYLRSDAQSAVVYYSVLSQLCEEAGVSVTDEQKAEYQASIAASVEANYAGDYDAFYRSYGLTEETLFYIYANNYLYNNYADTVLPQPTEADLEQYVEDNGIFGVKHILLMTASEDITDEEGNVKQTATEYNEELFARAVALREEIEAAEDPAAKFDELMLAHSEDTGLTAYPDGYTFSSSDSLVGGFREATLQLEVGEISGVVTTDYGYHIMLRLPVDPADYHDACLSASMDALLSEKMESAEVVLSDEIAALDVAEFYERYMAYGMALYEEMSALNVEEK